MMDTSGLGLFAVTVFFTGVIPVCGFIYSPAGCAYIWSVKRYKNFADVPRNLSAEPEHHRLRAQKRK